MFPKSCARDESRSCGSQCNSLSIASNFGDLRSSNNIVNIAEHVTRSKSSAVAPVSSTRKMSAWEYFESPFARSTSRLMPSNEEE